MLRLVQIILAKIYRDPKSAWKKYQRFGGYFRYRNMLAKNREMQKQADFLPPVISYKDRPSLYFLTGSHYLHQTFFCIQSLVRVTDEKFNFTLVDDGTFNSEIIDKIHTQLPGATIITKDQIELNLAATLPPSQFPYIYHKRKVYPHIKKLIDIHTLPGSKWKLVLDSDMLFWNRPSELENWLKYPKMPLSMLDCQNSYGYSYKLMENLCGCKIKPQINVGTIGLNSETINWDILEFWIKELEKREGQTYFLEQALSAMLIGDQDLKLLNPDKYIVNPVNTDYTETVLNHYVDISKYQYLTSDWKNFI